MSDMLPEEQTRLLPRLIIYIGPKFNSRHRVYSKNEKWKEPRGMLRLRRPEVVQVERKIEPKESPKKKKKEKGIGSTEALPLRLEIKEKLDEREWGRGGGRTLYLTYELAGSVSELVWEWTEKRGTRGERFRATLLRISAGDSGYTYAVADSPWAAPLPGLPRPRRGIPRLRGIPSTGRPLHSEGSVLCLKIAILCTPETASENREPLTYSRREVRIIGSVRIREPYLTRTAVRGPALSLPVTRGVAAGTVISTGEEPPRQGVAISIVFSSTSLRHFWPSTLSTAVPLDRGFGSVRRISWN